SAPSVREWRPSRRQCWSCPLLRRLGLGLLGRAAISSNCNIDPNIDVHDLIDRHTVLTPAIKVGRCGRRHAPPLRLGSVPPSRHGDDADAAEGGIVEKSGTLSGEPMALMLSTVVFYF